MEHRNTPEAPRLDHCATCGANALDGNGPIVDLNGHPHCELCAEGARALVADDPSKYGFDADGWLVRLVDDPDAVALRSAVTALTDQVRDLFGEGHGVTVEVFNPTSGVAVILPSGYRWHVYPPRRGLTDFTGHTAALFTPSRELVPGIPVIDLTNLADLVRLVDVSTDAGNMVGAAITTSQLVEAEIACFDPDVLLNRTD